MPLDRARDATLLCVVETPGRPADGRADAAATRGLYFVLMGRLSPLDGIGPREIRLDRLLERADRRRGRGSDPRHQLHRRGRGDRALHRRAAARARPEGDALARGVPVGGELEYVDSGTLAQAVLERRPA